MNTIQFIKSYKMSLKFIFFFVFLFSAKLYCQVMWQLKTDANTKWYLQENDEFDGSELNSKMWKYGYPWGNYVDNLDLLYKSENVVFENGVMSLITDKLAELTPILNEPLDAEYLKTKNKFPNEKGEFTYIYSGGAISSKKEYKYGYFEMRFKANAEKGIWPAFWLFGGNPSEEIDFYEGKGDRPNQIHLDVHCKDGCDNFKGGFLNLKRNWGAWVKSEDKLSDGWNIVSGEWQPDFIKFFLNGQPIGIYKGNFTTSKNLLINSAVAKNKEAFNPGPDEKTKFPNLFLVDYVRIWSMADTIYDIKDKYKLFESSPISIKENDLYATTPKGKVNFIYDKHLNQEQGVITLLPVFYNKYSLSIAGKNLGKIQVDVVDRFGYKVAGFGLEKVEYYILDLSELPTGPYDIKISVLNQTLVHNVPVINPEKIGESK
jgi:beta-glucanase (GH16 family)